MSSEATAATDLSSESCGLGIDGAGAGDPADAPEGARRGSMARLSAMPSPRAGIGTLRSEVGGRCGRSPAVAAMTTKTAEHRERHYGCDVTTTTDSSVIDPPS